MHHPSPAVGDDAALQAITAGLVALHEQYHGRPPKRVHTQMMGDDLVACLMGDMYTDIEKTLIELQRQVIVRETRSAFQQAMASRFIDVVKKATSREVVRFISTHHVGPDLEVELFFLEPLPQ